MPRWSGTSRRLLFAFGSLIAFIAAASYFAMAGLFEIHEALHAVKTEEEGVRGVLELGTAVRDQYAHQAHTIIIGDDSHLEMYDAARRRVHLLTSQVRGRVRPDDRASVDSIEESSMELDRIFRGEILPAVLEGRVDDARRAHGRVLSIVWAIQKQTDDLVQHFESSMGDFTEHVHAIEHTTYRWTAVLLASSVLFAAWVGLYIRKSVARPVARLEAGAARIAAGDLTTRIQIDSSDEFGRLAEQFNAMTNAIKEQREQLVETEKLAGIGRLAAGVAHEINNPLGVILGYVRLLRPKAEGSLADELRIIEDEAVRCQEIVEGLLDLSRPSLPPTTDVDLRALCEDVAGRLRESQGAGAARVTVTGEGLAPGHPQKLRQVLTNLIKNASEASGPGGAVEVRTALDSTWATVSIEDSGPGITPEARGRLFEPFFTTKPGGTGLGLAVSQAIARAHGGSIEVDRSPKGGALFTLLLPATNEGRA